MKKHLSLSTLLAWGSVTSLSLWHSPAQALSCDFSPYYFAPPADAQNVPTNTRLWGLAHYAHEIILSGPDGSVELVEMKLQLQRGLDMDDRFPVFQPAQLLDPDTRYTVSIVFSGSDGSEVVHEHLFTTGVGPATRLPDMPVLLSKTPGGGPSFSGGTGSWVQLDFEHQGILIGASEQFANSAESAENLEDLIRAAEVTEPQQGPTGQLAPEGVKWLDNFGNFRVGTGDCQVWPASQGAAISARFGVLDLAGNFSGWESEAHLLELPPISDFSAEIPAESSVKLPGDNPGYYDSTEGGLPERGCSTASFGEAGPGRAPASGWVLFGLFGFLLVRRRRVEAGG